MILIVLKVVVLKKCESELSCILAQLLNMCLKESSFPDCWKVSSIVLVFMNVGGLWLKTTVLLVFLDG